MLRDLSESGRPGCPIALRQAGMAVLLLAFLLQTAWVWADSSPSPALEGTALKGARLWHANNCQACHQVFGYGGFLGPDLTNAATVHGSSGLKARLTQVLSEGPGAMPVIETQHGDVEALAAWLEHLDDLGIGQARAPEAASIEVRFDEAMREHLPGGATARGYAVWQAGPCVACHAPLRTGPSGAPDLSVSVTRLDEQALEQVLTEGRPPRMPTPTLTDRERRDLTTWLRWLASERPDIEEALVAEQTLAWAEVPWWEFE